MCRKANCNCFIFFATISVSLSAFTTGGAFGWTSPYLSRFNSTDSTINPIGRPITIDESAWLVSAMSLGLNFGPFLSILSQKVFTKKQAILISMLPMVLAHSICIFTNKALLFILARLFMGIATGWLWAIFSIYIAEIAEDKNRGLLGCFPGITSNIGTLMVYLVGPYLSMSMFSVFNLIPMVIFYICFGIFVPDSPYDLVIKNRSDDALNSLKKLRRRENVKSELETIETYIKSVNKEKASYKDLFQKRVCRRGLTICISLMIFQQFSGNNAISSYAEAIFQSAGDFISSSLSPVLLGIVGTLSISLSSFLVDKMGRKPLLIVSFVVIGFSLFSLGIYFHLLNNGFNVSYIAWLPIVSLMFFVAAFNFSLGMVPWIITGEYFHSSLKAQASSLVSWGNFVTSFFVTLVFPYMIVFFGMSWTFYFFGIFMVLATIFCCIMLLESKEKSFQEIQDLLNK
ncbi:hypothetical protein ABEB36_005783 [Hypothenemus hampei]|uniref:Major facilitator superfamily (MFS) profile domain-containing protein n=1 Tax=Hypothenemus hampei TaxID=57062 RepID=A0ABD1F395_HYPHA